MPRGLSRRRSWIISWRRHAWPLPFLVIKSDKGREKIQACYPREWFKQAPCYIVVCGDHAQSWKRADGKDHMDIDAAIAAEHICLAAAEQGLGSCWVCNFDVALCRQLFGLPPTVEPVALIPVGYPEDEVLFETTPKQRKALADVVKIETF